VNLSPWLVAALFAFLVIIVWLCATDEAPRPPATEDEEDEWWTAIH
jgi:hypothetical protein